MASRRYHRLKSVLSSTPPTVQGEGAAPPTVQGEGAAPPAAQEGAAAQEEVAAAGGVAVGASARPPLVPRSFIRASQCFIARRVSQLPAWVCRVVYRASEKYYKQDAHIQPLPSFEEPSGIRKVGPEGHNTTEP